MHTATRNAHRDPQYALCPATHTAPRNVRRAPQCMPRPAMHAMFRNAHRDPQRTPHPQRTPCSAIAVNGCGRFFPDFHRNLTVGARGRKFCRPHDGGTPFPSLNIISYGKNEYPIEKTEKTLMRHFVPSRFFIGDITERWWFCFLRRDFYPRKSRSAKDRSRARSSGDRRSVISDKRCVTCSSSMLSEKNSAGVMSK